MDDYRVPKAMRAAFEAVVAATDAFCREHLDDEFAELCRKAAAALARKRPSPLSAGKPEGWALGIVYAIGQINFVFDKSQPYHMSADEIGAAFGMAASTAGNRGRQVRELLKIRHLDHQWMRAEFIESNSAIWLVSVNGLTVDVRRMPRAIQEEAYRKGYIPYIWADRK
jgi:hypothetical protein